MMRIPLPAGEYTTQPAKKAVHGGSRVAHRTVTAETCGRDTSVERSAMNTEFIGIALERQRYTATELRRLRNHDFREVAWLEVLESSENLSNSPTASTGSDDAPAEPSAVCRATA